MLELLGAVGSWMRCQEASPSRPISVGSSTPCCGELGLLSLDPVVPSSGHSWLSNQHDHLHCPVFCAEVAASWHSWKGR